MDANELWNMLPRNKREQIIDQEVRKIVAEMVRPLVRAALDDLVERRAVEIVNDETKGALAKAAKNVQGMAFAAWRKCIEDAVRNEMKGYCVAISLQPKGST